MKTVWRELFTKTQTILQVLPVSAQIWDTFIKCPTGARCSGRNYHRILLDKSPKKQGEGISKRVKWVSDFNSAREKNFHSRTPSFQINADCTWWMQEKVLYKLTKNQISFMGLIQRGSPTTHISLFAPRILLIPPSFYWNNAHPLHWVVIVTVLRLSLSLTFHF